MNDRDPTTDRATDRAPVRATVRAAGNAREVAASTALGIGAVVLVGLIALTATGWFARPALADQAVKDSDYSAMTAGVAGGARELLFMTDDVNETMLIYDVLNNRSVELVGSQDLPTLFVRARGGAGRRP